MNVMADRSQEGGLCDHRLRRRRRAKHRRGISDHQERCISRTTRWRWARQRLIGRAQSNGCAYGDSPTSFPIQRMPNISLQPNPNPTSLDDLFADVKDGIYIVGNAKLSASTSNDTISSSPDSCSSKSRTANAATCCGMSPTRAARRISGTPWMASATSRHIFSAAPFSAPKGSRQQSAPVSHGAVPARFRRINVLNTERTDA